MRIISFTALVITTLVSSVSAQSIVLSTSDLDPAAGTSITISPNQFGSLYIWANPEDGQKLVGMGIDILSSDPSVLEGTSHIIFDPPLAGGAFDRWDGINTGVLGDLVTGANAVAVTQLGIQDSNVGLGDVSVNGFFLHAQIDFLATGMGTTDITLAANSFGVADLNGLVTPTFGGAMVSVIPEPSTFLFAAICVGLMGLTVRKRRCQRAG